MAVIYLTMCVRCLHIPKHKRLGQHGAAAP